MKKRMIVILTVVWLVVLFRITVFRAGCFSHGLLSGRVEWAAFAYYATLARVGNWRYFLYLFVGNLVWFAPAGVLARLLGKGFWTGVLWGFLLSLLVEALQYLLGSGVTELDDLILNTAGAALGYAAASLVTRRKTATM